MRNNILISLLVIFVVFSGVFFTLIFSPVIYTSRTVIVIKSNESISDISKDLRDHHIIPSTFLFKIYMKITEYDRKIIPGDYLFTGSQPIFVVGNRVASGNFNIEQKKIVIPEGSNIKDIAIIIKKTYPDFDTNGFIKEAKLDEGYLFPDSYDLFESTSTTFIIKTLKDNFVLKTKNLKIDPSVVILASILEEEGKFEEDRKIISGILQNRLKEGQALQVDSTFQYINGKTSKDLTQQDLKINSPYNTYINTGLPPTPISNPGLESLEAVINPTHTDYLYFLTGDDGNMYYAKTFEEHLRNKKKYIK